MDGKQAAIVVRDHFEEASEMCPCLGFQTYSITRVVGGYEVICSVCPTIFGYGGRYRALVDHDGKLDRLERVDMRPELTDVDVVPDSIIIGNLRRINTRQHKQICDHCETIGGLRATVSELEERDARKTTAIDELQKTIGEMKSKVEPPNLAVMALLHNLNVKIETLEAELSARKEDSMVLMRVVDALREWQGDPYNPRHMIERMRHIVGDRIAAPEIPDRKETDVITDQVIDEALDTIVSNMLNETADALRVDVADRDRRIKYLDAKIDKKSMFISSLLRNDKRLNRLLDGRRADVRDRDKIIASLRVDVAGRDKRIEALKSTVDFGQSRIDLLVEKKSNCIDESMKDLDARNTVIKDFKAIEQKETDRLHKTIDELTLALAAYREQNINQYNKLNGVKDVLSEQKRDRLNMYTTIDEITKIIQGDKP